MTTIILASFFSLSAQSYTDDSLIVREILDLNGLDTVEVDAVTSKISNRVYALYLHDMNISVLPESLGNLDSLQNLQIQNNRLTALPESIGNCTRLRYLSAYYNHIHELPESIANCSELDLLYLLGNKFTKFPKVVLEFKKMLTLSLSNNHLTEVPAEIANYEREIQLSISNNYLMELPEAFTSMKPEYINVIGNLLCSVSEEMEQWLDTYDYYKDIDDRSWRSFQGCERQVIDSTIVQKVLDENGIEYLDVVTVTESNDLGVVTLDLSAENITPADNALLGKQSTAAKTFILPSDIDSLKSLKTLNLSGNLLTELPAELHRLCHITSLDISGNNLTWLPEYLVSFKNIELLDVSGNSLDISSEKLQTWLSKFDPDWKETQQTTGIYNSLSSLPKHVSQVALTRINNTKLIFDLNIPQSTRGCLSLYSLNGKVIFSTGMRLFHEKTTEIELRKNIPAAGTCYAVLKTDSGMSTVTFTITR